MSWFKRLFGGGSGRRVDTSYDGRFFVVVDDTAPDLEDPALLIHVVNLADGNMPSVARRRVRWESIPASMAYFTRKSSDPGLRPVSRSAAADVAKLWGAPWPPPE